MLSISILDGKETWYSGVLQFFVKWLNKIYSNIKPISIHTTENNACYDIHTLFLIFPF